VDELLPRKSTNTFHGIVDNNCKGLRVVKHARGTGLEAEENRSGDPGDLSAASKPAAPFDQRLGCRPRRLRCDVARR